METTITSPNKIVKIGPDHPFVIIGERINPTGRKLLGKEMAAGNFDRVRQDAIAQVQAGAHMIDINAGIPMADEPGILAEAIQVVQSVVDAPISIDSSIIGALEAGLKAYQGKPLVNSVTGEEERLEVILPFIAEHKAAVIGVANDASGISHDVDVRFAVAKLIVERAESYGIPREDVIIDPLAMPVGAIPGAGPTLFKLISRISNELGVNTCLGASNVSFGLPARPALNAAFLAMAIGAGLTSAITNPLEPEMYTAILGGDVFMDHDDNCEAWIAHNKSKVTEGEAGVRRSRRSVRVEQPTN